VFLERESGGDNSKQGGDESNKARDQRDPTFFLVHGGDSLVAVILSGTLPRRLHLDRRSSPDLSTNHRAAIP
jgi:hypothetical protein